MTLTRRKAFEEAISIWKYLWKTGDLNKPKVLEYKYIHGCPLCHLYFKKNCVGCYLDTESTCSKDGCYQRWYYAETKETKQKYAKQMLNALRRGYNKLK